MYVCINNKLNSTLVLVSDTPLPKEGPPASTWPAGRRQTSLEGPSGKEENEKKVLKKTLL